ncbi:MAG: phosphotransferase [Acidimicrobiia bacterium]
MSSTDASLVEVLPAHRFDEEVLRRYLSGRLPGFDGEIAVRQFQGGQSNPTFHVQTDAGAYVLRKKPGGQLLASAHAIDREFTVMRALAGTGVPVPRVDLYCDDAEVIGQEFYVMEHIAGRVLRETLLPDLDPSRRAGVWLETVRVLAKVHRVDHRAVGLDSFGRSDGYIGRQVNRWSRQYEDSKVEDNADMDRLIEWLRTHDAPADEASIVHGDYRTHNVIFHPDEDRIVAVIDWELSTIGHPLADLAYCCLPYHLAPDDTIGLRGSDPASVGLPSERELLEAYCREAGRPDAGDWNYFVVFAMFRMAAIRAGIFKRARSGNAANADAMAAGLRYRITATRAWALAQQHD